MASALKQTTSETQILKKHVSTIHAVADLSALQRKLVNALLFNAYDGLLTVRDHKISTRILCDMIGFDSKNIAYLKEALVGIMETVMQFDIMEDDGERSWEAMSLLTVTSRKLVRNFLEQLWFEFVPVFHGLQGRFAAQD
jgi:hypothetical protein